MKTCVEMTKKCLHVFNLSEKKVNFGKNNSKNNENINTAFTTLKLTPIEGSLERKKITLYVLLQNDTQTIIPEYADIDRSALNKLLEGLFIQELLYFKKYLCFYPYNPVKTQMIDLLLDKKNSFVNNIKLLEDKHFLITRFNFCIEFYNSFFGKEILFKNPAFSYQAENRTKLLTSYSYLPHTCYYYYLFNKKIDTYTCNFSFSLEHICFLYPSITKREDMSNLSIVKYFNESDLLKEFKEKKTPTKTKDKIFSILKKILYLPEKKLLTKSYLRGLLEGYYFFIPLKNKEILLSSKRKPFSNLSACKIYEELDLIVLKLFGKNLGFKKNHIPKKKWLLEVLHSITTKNVVDLNDIDSDSSDSSGSSNSSDNSNNFLSHSSNSSNSKYSELSYYYFWKMFEHYQQIVFSGNYFFFKQNLNKEMKIKYIVINSDETDDSSQDFESPKNGSDTDTNKNNSNIFKDQNDGEDQMNKERLSKSPKNVHEDLNNNFDTNDICFNKLMNFEDSLSFIGKRSWSNVNNSLFKDNTYLPLCDDVLDAPSAQTIIDRSGFIFNNDSNFRNDSISRLNYFQNSPQLHHNHNK